MELNQDSIQPKPQHDVEAVQKVIETERNVRLTSSELSVLWASWMESSIKECFVKYFLRTTGDTDIRQVLEYVLNIAQKHLQIISEIYAREGHPLPRGFKDEDINPQAPGLFTDSFILAFLEDLARSRLDGYSTALQMSSRSDVRKFLTECVADPAEIYNRVVTIMLSKGIYNRPPHIPVPEKVDFIKKQKYLTGYLGKRRPLNAIDISHIFLGLQRNLHRKALITGFAQVTGSEQVYRYMIRGMDIATKHIEIFSGLLMENELPVSMSWDDGVTDSKTAPFSDNLMMNHVRASNVIMGAAYGKALHVVGLRHDLGIDFMRLLGEIQKYLEDGANIQIDNGWMEEPPQAKGPDKSGRLFH